MGRISLLEDAHSPASLNSPPPVSSPPPEQPSSPPPATPPANPNASLPVAPSTPSLPPPLSPPTIPTLPPSSPPPASPPPLMATPPPNSTATPPPEVSSPPPDNNSVPPPSPTPPNDSTPPPNPTPPSSPPPASPPPSTAPEPPAPPPIPPETSPPPPKAPESSPEPPAPSTPQIPPPSPEPPRSSPPPSPEPPRSSPPPPTQGPPRSSPPPPRQEPPSSSPPSPPPDPPENSPPSPPSGPPENSPPPPPSDPTATPPPAPISSVPSPPGQLSPPPSPLLPPSQPGTSLVPPDAPTNDSSSIPTNSPRSDGKGLTTGAAVAIGVVFGFLLLGAFGMAAWCLWRRKKKSLGNAGYVMPTSLGSSPHSDTMFLKSQASPANATSDSGLDSASDTGGMGNSRAFYSYEELAKATDEFSEQNLLGKGGFGSVYKGCLPDGRVVAVKQLKDGGGQGEREFRAEVETISRVHHRHLVSLVGYCISNDRRLLVYDYAPNDTLHFHLHGQESHVLDWALRVKIAVGAARGIAYLHEDCHPRIIHRDIKSSNILLDNNFEARVSDFGLAKLFSDANTHVTTRVMGTFGYMAPEYASSGKLTEKSDVFSFGVVLLELITGRKPVDTSQPLGEESLVEWARPLLNHALDTEEFEPLVDPRLDRNYVDGEMFRMIEAAAACVRHSAARRPRMTQILRAFDNFTVSDLSNGMRVGESEAFNSAEQSAEIRLFRRMAFGSQDYTISELYSQGSWKSEER